VLMYADNECVDHLDRLIMRGSERTHDPAPDASPPPTNEAVVAVVRGPGGSRHNAPDRKTQKIPLRTRRSSTRGTPRGFFGSIDLMTLHSNSVSSYP
jgi:hypothetical protein